jgi:hypothetical protein
MSLVTKMINMGQHDRMKMPGKTLSVMHLPPTPSATHLSSKTGFPALRPAHIMTGTKFPAIPKLPQLKVGKGSKGL